MKLGAICLYWDGASSCVSHQRLTTGRMLLVQAQMFFDSNFWTSCLIRHGIGQNVQNRKEQVCICMQDGGVESLIWRWFVCDVHATVIARRYKSSESGYCGSKAARETCHEYWWAELLGRCYWVCVVKALALTCLVYPAQGQIRSNVVCKDAHL